MFRAAVLATALMTVACGTSIDANRTIVSGPKPKVILAYEVPRKPKENLRTISLRFHIPLSVLEQFNPRDGQARRRNMVYVPIGSGPKQSDLRIVTLARDPFLRPVKIGDWSAAEEVDLQSLDEWFIPDEAQRLSFPVEGYISSGFSWRWNRFHKGLDIAAMTGTPILAAQDGRVAFRGWRAGFGLLVIIDHKIGRTYYAHCQSANVKVGQNVARGDVIAKVGSTGHTQGIHLHFEYRDNLNQAVDPTPFLMPPCTRPVVLSAQPISLSAGTSSWAAKPALCRNSDI